MRIRWALALALTGAAALACAAGAAGASRTLTLDGWSPRVLAFSGDHLLWTEAAPVRIDPARVEGAPAGATPFRYYRAETSRAPLARASTRFAAPPETPVAVRTSIAAMEPGVLVPAGRGDFLMVPGSRRFAPPAIHCCDDEGVETVLESDGRPDAPVTIGATLAGGRALLLMVDGAGRQRLRSVDLATGAAQDAALPDATASPGLAALAPTARSWVDPGAPATLMLWRTGAAAPDAVPLPGRAVRVWSAAGLSAVAVRRGRAVLLMRIDHEGAPRARRAWAGRRVPAVALGGRSLAVADGPRVLAARRGGLRQVARARRRVDGVGVSGRRVAWVERGLRRGARVGVVRLGRVR